jgi:hypothetical protein
VVVVVFAFQAARATLALRQARAQATQLQKQVSSGDEAGARHSLRDLQKSSATAHGASDNVLWDVASHVPVLGDNVEAVQLISSALDAVSRDALPVGLDLVVAAREGSLQEKDGRFDLAELRRITPSVDRAAVTVKMSRRKLASIQPTQLLSPLRRPAFDLQRRFDTLDGAVGSGAAVVRLLPDMLGGSGPRKYLLVAQNTAELRATGGLPGSLSIITARDGRIRQGFRGSAADFPLLARPVRPLAADEQSLYGDALGKDIRQANQTPDFPRAAELMSAIVDHQLHVKLDGVVAVDPVALSIFLGVTGPLKAAGDTLTSDNVVAKVLSEAYSRFADPNEQNAYFAGVSGDAFDALIKGGNSQENLLRAVQSAVGERRLLLWSRHKAEERTIASSKLSGALPQDSGAAPHVGIYINDYSQAKIDYYLDYRAQVGSDTCRKDRGQTVVAKMVLASSVPRPVSKLPEYVTGLGEVAAKGTISLAVYIYAPTGGKLTGLSVDGEARAIDVKNHDGHQVSVLTLQIKPGQAVELLISMGTRAGQDGDPVLQWTPGMRRQLNDATAPSACR